MESISSYLAANPTVFTLLTIFSVILILYFILSKFIKLAIILLVVIQLFGGVSFFKDPAPMPEKIKQSVQTFKTGGEQVWDKFSSLWRDTKSLADKAKKAPGDINKLLDPSKDPPKKDAGK